MKVYLSRTLTKLARWENFKMAKVHLKITGVDARSQGQTEHENSHQTACGFVRDNVTKNNENITCFYCLKQINER
jgi:hypothetical protein